MGKYDGGCDGCSGLLVVVVVGIGIGRGRIVCEGSLVSIGAIVLGREIGMDHGRGLQELGRGNGKD